MKKVAKVFFNIACIIGVIVAVWHFSVPYSSNLVCYIPECSTEIINQ